MTVRVAASNGTEDTFKVTEWVGTGLPPHVAGYQQGFFTRYQDPTENRAQLDKLAADFPNLVTAVNLPNLTGGYQRKSSAILYGANAIGSAPAAPIGAAIFDTDGRDHGRGSGRADPVQRDRRAELIATVDGVPSGSTDFILTLKDPSGANVGNPVDTGTSPEFLNRTFATAGTYTFEISGYQGDLGDFTFKRPAGAPAPPRRRRTARSCSPPRTGATSVATRSPPSSRPAPPARRCPSP